MEISDEVLIAAATARGSAFENLLTRDRSIEISESVLEASAEYGPLSRVELILEREPGLKPTNRILEAAARRERFTETFENKVTYHQETEAGKIMKLALARNDELQISDQVLEAALPNYDEELNYEEMKFLLSRPGVVISESVLITAIHSVLSWGSSKVWRLILASNFDVCIATSEAVLVAAAGTMNGPRLLELLLNSATDAKVKVKEKQTEVPVETQQEVQSLLPKDRKVYITEKVLVAAANSLRSMKYLLGYDPEIRITGSIADAIMSKGSRGLDMRLLLLSEFKENLTQEALEKLVKPEAH